MASNSYVKTIDHLERLKNTHNGNPRFRIHFTDGGEAITKSDSYIAMDLLFKPVVGKQVLIETTRAGRVESITPVEG